MTQIRSMAQPVQKRPGELGVHSLDAFNFMVPDLAQAEKFYGDFGLNLKEENGSISLYTHGHPHKWGSVSEGPRKKMQFVSFGAYEEDMPKFQARIQEMRLDRLDPPKGFEFERHLAARSVRHAGRDPRRREKLAEREVGGRRIRRQAEDPERAEPQQSARVSVRAGSRTFWCSPPTSRRPSRGIATCSACGCRIAPAT